MTTTTALPATVRIQNFQGTIYSVPARVIRATATMLVVRQDGFQADTRFRLSTGYRVGAAVPHLEDRIHGTDLAAIRAALAPAAAPSVPAEAPKVEAPAAPAPDLSTMTVAEIAAFCHRAAVSVLGEEEVARVRAEAEAKALEEAKVARARAARFLLVAPTDRAAQAALQEAEAVLASRQASVRPPSGVAEVQAAPRVAPRLALVPAPAPLPEGAAIKADGVFLSAAPSMTPERVLALLAPDRLPVQEEAEAVIHHPARGAYCDGIPGPVADWEDLGAVNCPDCTDDPEALDSLVKAHREDSLGEAAARAVAEDPDRILLIAGERGEAPFQTTLAALALAEVNSPSLVLAVAALAPGQTYYGGGGAASHFAVSRPVAPVIPARRRLLEID